MLLFDNIYNSVERVYQLTAMYALVPTYVFVMELTSWALTPKSQSLTSPWALTSIFDGLTSRWNNQAYRYVIITSAIRIWLKLLQSLCNYSYTIKQNTQLVYSPNYRNQTKITFCYYCLQFCLKSYYYQKQINWLSFSKK